MLTIFQVQSSQRFLSVPMPATASVGVLSRPIVESRAAGAAQSYRKGVASQLMTTCG
jgi:hypothetical protein